MFPSERPVNSYMTCPVCRGKRVDPKKRTRKCPKCKGNGLDEEHCDKCGKTVFHGCLIDPDADYCTCYGDPGKPPLDSPQLSGTPRMVPRA